MRTPTSFIKSLSAVLTGLVFVGWSGSASAEESPAADKEKPAAEVTAPAAPAAKQPTPPQAQPAAPQAPSTTTVTTEPTPPEGQVEPEPASVMEVGVQRLPGYAYPSSQTRGLMYGSLWLTFHGLQWPYMPAMPKGKRFVIGLSGWGWVDNAIEKFAPYGEHPNLENAKVKYWKQQSRLLLRITPTYAFDNDWFVQGQVELVGTGDQTTGRSDLGGADTDDLYLRVGQWNKWDIQVGRYEGWEVFHLGMGLDQNTFERQGAVGPGESSYPIGFYGLTDNQFRPQGAAGNVALHYYPLRILRFELLGMTGSLSGPALATRPVGILDLGWLKLKVGTEYRKETGQLASQKTDITSKGVGGALQFVFDPYIEFGINAAQGTIWKVDSTGRTDLKGSYTRTSYGAFANVSNGSRKHPVMFGAGALYTHTEDQNDVLGNGNVDKLWLFQGYLAAQYVAFQQLYIKLVGGYSRGHWQTSESDPPIQFDDEMYSVRLRLAFYF